MRVIPRRRSVHSSADRRRVRHLAEARRDDHEHARVRWVAHERREELDGLGVRPVDVIEDQDRRSRRREALEECAHRPVGAVALVLEDAA